MAKKFAFIGAPGSGKTTLVADVFASLKRNGANAELIQEWIRQDIHAHGISKTIWEQYRIRQHQKELEDAVPVDVEFVIADSSTLMSYFYACLYADHADSRQRLVLQDMYRYLLDDLYLKRYDTVFYLPVHDLPESKLKDGVRFQSKDEIKVLEEHMELVFCKLFKPGNIHRIDGALNTRLSSVMKIIYSKEI